MAEICPALPKDLFVNEILVRLPAKSIGRSRCVSKPWRSLLSSPQFVKSHFKFHLNDDPPENHLFITGSSGHDPNVRISFLAEGSSISGVPKEVIVPFYDRSNSNVCLEEGSCHGLILLSQFRDKSSKILFNPVTLEAELITSFLVSRFSTLGLGYDSFSDDFKIVLISNDFLCVRNPYRVDVYSVKAKVWKRAADSDYNFHNDTGEICFGISGMFLNGCIHWLAYPVITAFSLCREEFETVEPPSGLDLDDAILSLLGGCLALVVFDSYFTEVWMMKEYGVQDSWMKFNISHPGFQRYVPHKPVFFLGDDEVVVVKPSRVLAYNLRNGSWRDLVFAGLPHFSLYHIRTFTVSLVSPNYNQE